MHQADVQEIECLLALAEELHFGRTAIRLGHSQSRVSQLVASLERRVGVRLVERTSRRVELTRFGAQFVAEVGPAYDALNTVFTRARARARRGELHEVRMGFHGSIYEEITEAFRRLRAHHEVTMALTEIPWGSPFAAVLDGRVDAAVVELPVREPDLTVGFVFPAQEHLLAVPRHHPLAAGAHDDGDHTHGDPTHDASAHGSRAPADVTHNNPVHVEELAHLDVLRPAGDAPEYWTAARVPHTTPAGAPVRSSTGVSTVQEGLALVAAGDHAMLVCRPMAERITRSDVRYLAVDGLTEPSRLALIWRTDRTTAQLSALAQLLADEFPAAPLPPKPR